ncbi:MAG: SPOR domain-containing protein [Flavobacteriales bacterium]|nr:SPOR domain-containing protein [Flavobacteriales bacterium]
MLKYLLVAFFFVPIITFGQTTDSLQTYETSLLGDQRVKNLLQRHINLNKEKGVMGWRLQIFSNTDREKAQEVRTRFLQNFPEIRAYLTHKAPYFKVVVGNFHTKLQAKKVQSEISSKFRCYIVPSKVIIFKD